MADAGNITGNGPAQFAVSGSQMAAAVWKSHIQEKEELTFDRSIDILLEVR